MTSLPAVLFYLVMLVLSVFGTYVMASEGHLIEPKEFALIVGLYIAALICGVIVIWDITEAKRYDDDESTDES